MSFKWGTSDLVIDEWIQKYLNLGYKIHTMQLLPSLTGSEEGRTFILFERFAEEKEEPPGPMKVN
jgi:hypothetical protein